MSLQLNNVGSDMDTKMMDVDPKTDLRVKTDPGRYIFLSKAVLDVFNKCCTITYGGALSTMRDAGVYVSKKNQFHERFLGSNVRLFVGSPTNADVQKAFPECKEINDQYIVPDINDVRPILSTHY